MPETTSPAAKLGEAAKLMRERADHAAAEFVTSMHPGVALALAEWLETEAHMADWRGNSVEGQTFGALKVARAYLGTTEARSATRDETARSRPRIVCLCGSTRFGEAFREANLRLTLAGEIVLSIGCDTKADGDLAAAGALGRDLEQVKADLDELHRHKIELADYVLVLNVGGYVGTSTRGEIEHARALGKPVEYLEGGTND